MQFFNPPSPQPPRPDGPGFIETARLGFRQAQRFEELTSARRFFEEELAPFAEFVEHNQALLGPRDFSNRTIDDTFRRLDRLREAGVAIPDALAIGRDRFIQETLDKATAEARAGARRLAQGSSIAAFAGGAAAGFDDIENVSTLLLGAPARAGLLGTLAVEGLIGGGTEVVANRNRAPFLEAIGLGAASDLQAFAMGSAGAGASFLALRGAVSGTRAAVALGRNLVSRLGRERVAEAAEKVAPEGSPVKVAAQRVLDDVRDERAAQLPPGDRDAVAEHETRLTETRAAMDERRAPALPERPVIARPSTAEPTLAEDQTVLLDPDTILVMPETFQFKSDVDELGQTEALKGVTEWRPERAGIVMVYQFADGRIAVTDGHQRVGLARRIKAATGQDIRLRGFVQREIDGVTVEEARVTAAMKNIVEAKEGLTAARAKDAAKILRLRPEEIANLPAGPGIVRARELASLSDDAFGMYINAVVPERFAAAVGRLAGRDPTLHADLLRILERAEPQTTAQAESIIRQALEAPRREETTASLFGEETFSRSLFLERAKVLERALAILRKDRQIFGTLVKERKRIEAGADNRLATATNEEIAKEVENAIAQVQALAHRRGPIGDALGRAAEKFADTGRLGDSASELAESVRAAIRDGGLAREEIGAGRRAPEPQGSDATRAEPGVEDGTIAFAEPGGTGQRAQAGELIPPRGPDERQMREGFEGDQARRAELEALVDANAPRAEIDAHPVVVDALARMDAIPRTKDSAGYGSAEWHASREFHFPDGRGGIEKVSGTNAAIKRHYTNAVFLAADETGNPRRDPLYERRLTILLGPPAAGKSTIANQIALARRAAILDSDEIKKTLPEFQGGIGASAVHEESADLADTLAGALTVTGVNVVYPKVGGTVDAIAKIAERFRVRGYTVELVNMAVKKEIAYRRMIRRFVNTGRLIDPKYVHAVGEKPSATFRDLIARSEAGKEALDGWAEIDNNGGIGEARPITVRGGTVDPLRGTGYAVRAGGGADNVRARREPGAPADRRGGRPALRPADDGSVTGKFLVVRQGTSPDLRGKNAANAAGYIDALERTGDFESTVDLRGNDLIIYEVDSRAAAGNYKPVNRGNLDGGTTIGVVRQGGGWWYSFGTRGDYQATEIARVPVAELRAEIISRKIESTARRIEGSAEESAILENIVHARYDAAQEARGGAAAPSPPKTDPAAPEPNQEAGGIPQGRPVTDPGPDGGAQLVIPGAERITDREFSARQIKRRMEARLAGGSAEPGGLFGPHQSDLFDEVPVGVRVVDGETTVDTRSFEDIRRELDREDDFAGELEACSVGARNA